MKNILFWAGLLVATFWDEVLLASIKPEKTKRQQKFLQTGETAQYFIGEIEDEVITLLKKLFAVKKIVKSKKLFKSPEWDGTDIYEINGGVKQGHMTLILVHQLLPTVKNYSLQKTYYEAFISNGYIAYYYDDVISHKLFGENDKDVYDGYKNDVLYSIWNNYILEWNKYELDEKVENFEQIEQIANTDIELAFILLSGVPNIKKILE